MFTGIIEALGKIEDIVVEGENHHITLSGPFTDELTIDQSVAHNGVCLTVVNIEGDHYTVTAIAETMRKTSLSEWERGAVVNLERCMKMGGRLDGHIVQGHVDQVGTCSAIAEEDGSWIFTFTYEPTRPEYVTVEKGSITVNGTSLTVVNSKEKEFSVAIIPYTYEHTVFHTLKVGSKVNLEFDIIGKYVAKLASIQG
ncbi:MAG: riboflavin synthase [Schleiferiaceae bacterium]